MWRLVSHEFNGAEIVKTQKAAGKNTESWQLGKLCAVLFAESLLLLISIASEPATCGEVGERLQSLAEATVSRERDRAVQAIDRPFDEVLES